MASLVHTTKDGCDLALWVGLKQATQTTVLDNHVLLFVGTAPGLQEQWRQTAAAAGMTTVLGERAVKDAASGALSTSWPPRTPEAVGELRSATFDALALTNLDISILCVSSDSIV